MAVEDGYRESAESWLTVLRGLHERGLEAPLLAIGDGALGFWKALSEVWPQTAEQRCWVHRTANVLDKLPKRLQPQVRTSPWTVSAIENPLPAATLTTRTCASASTRFGCSCCRVSPWPSMPLSPLPHV